MQLQEEHLYGRDAKSTVVKYPHKTTHPDSDFKTAGKKKADCFFWESKNVPEKAILFI